MIYGPGPARLAPSRYLGTVTQDSQYQGEGAEGSPANMPAPPEQNTPTVSTPGGQVTVAPPPVFDARGWAIRFATNSASVGPQIAALPSDQQAQILSAYLNYMVGEQHNDLQLMQQQWDRFVLGIQPPAPAAPPTCPVGSVWSAALQRCVVIPPPESPPPIGPPIPAPATAPGSGNTGSGSGSTGSGASDGTQPTTPGVPVIPSDLPPDAGGGGGTSAATAPATAGFSGMTAVLIGLGLIGAAIVAAAKKKR